MKKYYTIRFSDYSLFKKAKKRAIDEGISLLELLHKAVADYLKKSVNKEEK